ncbi:VOC family protein [Wenjunlia tyrosinilytica]|uniref:VOC domain-containing protein n=1 Tax=Wenjunlia tyrosinilytica TaxID=1544741 RepID=A0A918DX34_9ACTN|nr:VOC family protein [Wenjunlia tyrosinilytica]GGO87754.1 hypothetical protein GCM10012280_26950 [Wenjunlia tyrosinilytica]
MRKRIRAAQGTPCWVSLLTGDLEAAKKFYGGLLGWRYRLASQQPGPYVLAISDGVPVAGLAATAHQMGFPVSWTSYFAADDANEIAQRIRERGGTVAVGPVEFGNGRVAWAADPAGAVFGVWEGEIDPVWRIERRAGAPAWLELRTGDAFAAAIFYGDAFGWDTGDPRYEIRYEHDRVILRIEGRTVAGLFGGAVEDAPDPRIRPRWQVYFCVGDVDAATRLAAELGGTVVSEPNDSPFGRVATVRDPEGGLFSLASSQ